MTGTHLQEAYAVLGLDAGVSPFRARRRYRELVRGWHPDRHPKDPELQARATQRTQEIIAAYRRIKDAAGRGEVPLRTPRAWRPSPTGGPPIAVVDTARDRVVRFIGGAPLGLVLDFWMLADSALVWVIVPLVAGTVVAVFGWSIVEWIFRKLWWLDWL